jgi:ABC-type phosphate transport system substrate-binding protein
MFLACIPAAASVVALAAPGAANATLLQQCAGEGIAGQGSTLQELAQKKLWDSEAATATDFNGSSSALACSGSQGSHGKPEVKYTGTGSGPGMESWYVEEHFGPTNAFIGTDQPPDKEVKEKIEALGASETLLTIPTLQASVAIIAHLPAGCTVTGNPTGRLELTNKELEEIFDAETLKKPIVALDKWSQLGSQNALSGSGCKPETEFKRVVRLEGSGTTATLEKYLDLINKKAVVEPGKKTWKILGEELENTTWPNQTANPVLRGKGSGGLITEVVNNASTIGYVNLANARGNAALVEKGEKGLGTGGKGTQTFWAEIQNNGVGAKAKYADPATNLDVEAKANANCKEEKYTNGKVKFPPASTTEPWNEVTTKTTQKFYTLCGFTYDLSLSDFEAYSGHGATQGEATTAANYLNWVVNDEAGGGQGLLEGNDYLPLPSAKAPKPSVLKIAQEGAALINW